jgi:hypothetical protein
MKCALWVESEWPELAHKLAGAPTTRTDCSEQFEQYRRDSAIGLSLITGSTFSYGGGKIAITIPGSPGRDYRG